MTALRHKHYFIIADNIKNPPNLHEEIVAMAKIDSGASASPLRLNLSQDVKDSRVNSTYESDYSVPTKKAKNRDKLVQEFRISVRLSIFKFLTDTFYCILTADA